MAACPAYSLLLITTPGPTSINVYGRYNTKRRKKKRWSTSWNRVAARNVNKVFLVWWITFSSIYYWFMSQRKGPAKNGYKGFTWSTALVQEVASTQPMRRNLKTRTKQKNTSGGCKLNGLDWHRFHLTCISVMLKKCLSQVKRKITAARWTLGLRATEQDSDHLDCDTAQSCR